MFNKILFPVDLSEASNLMVPSVKEVVDKFEAELHIIHAKSVDRYFIATFVDETQLSNASAEEKRLQEFIESNSIDLSVPARILNGAPGPEIIKYAEDEKMELIIMGHSSTGVARAVFGSVAGHVVKHSPVPVLIISPSILKKK